MKHLFFVVLSCAVILGTGCSTVKVQHEYDPTFDFSSLRTFGWMPVPEENVRYGTFLKYMKHEMAKQLQARGYVFNEESPDLLIAFHGGFQPRLSYPEWSYLEEHYRSYWARRRIDVIKYQDGQLIADFVATGSREMVCRATATAFMSYEPTTEEAREKIGFAISKILEKCPPR